MAVWWYAEIQRQQGEDESSNRARSGLELADRRRRAAQVAEFKVHQRRAREAERRAREVARFEARQRRREKLSYLLRCGWYPDLPDWGQAVVLGLAFAIPGAVVVALLFRWAM